jgi:hypothetical protein
VLQSEFKARVSYIMKPCKREGGREGGREGENERERERGFK